MATLEDFLTVAMLVPLQHPSDPTCIMGVPVNLVGLSGIGKSERITAIGKAIGLKVWPVYATTKQPEDFTGAFVPTTEGIIIECVLPAARRCIDDGEGVIFLDEISDARPAVQAALHSFVNERRVGDHVLPPKTRILLAMNPPDQATAGYGLSAPMANRMAHIDYEAPTWDQWVAWLQHQNPMPTETVKDAEKRVRDSFDDYWPKVMGLGAGFHRSTQGSKLHVQPKSDSSAAGGPWPSHRTWNWLLRSMTTVRCLGADPALEYEFGKALLGKGVANEFRAWVKKADLPDPEDMLTKGWTMDKHKLDVSYAAINSMASFVTSRKTKQDRVKFALPAWQIIKDVMDGGNSDLLVQPTDGLVKADLAHECTDPKVKKLAEDVIYQLSKDGYYEFVKK